MQAESIGKVLPRTLLPYLQRWAERSGLTLLSQVLADDEFCTLIEKYGDELVTRMGRTSHTPANGARRANGSKPVPRAQPSVDDSDADAWDSDGLRARVCAMEARLEAQQAGFEILRSTIRPLALALGCCPECLAGVDGCPSCCGRGKVAYYEPDRTLLATKVVNPLAAHGVPIVLGASEGTTNPPKESTAKRKRSRRWKKK